MKRKGALLVASNERRCFTLRFYPDREESFGAEALLDLEIPDSDTLGRALSAMGFSGVPAFLEHLGEPPEILEFLEIQLTKEELRKFGLLGAPGGSSATPLLPPSRRDEREDTGH